MARDLIVSDLSFQVEIFFLNSLYLYLEHLQFHLYAWVIISTKIGIDT